MKLIFTLLTSLALTTANAQYETIYECGTNTQSGFFLENTTLMQTGGGSGTFMFTYYGTNPDSSFTTTIYSDNTSQQYIVLKKEISDLSQYADLKFYFEADVNNVADESFIYIGPGTGDFFQWDLVEYNQLGDTVNYINTNGYSTIVMGFLYIPEDTTVFNFNHFMVSADTTKFVGMNEVSQELPEINIIGSKLLIQERNMSTYQLSVFNLMGQRVLSQNCQGETEINLDLNEGLYIVNINSGEFITEKKIWVSNH